MMMTTTAATTTIRLEPTRPDPNWPDPSRPDRPKIRPGPSKRALGPVHTGLECRSQNTDIGTRDLHGTDFDGSARGPELSLVRHSDSVAY